MSIPQNRYVEQAIEAFNECLVWYFHEDKLDRDRFSSEMQQQISLMVYDFTCLRIGLHNLEGTDPALVGHDLCLKAFGTGARFKDRDCYSPALASWLDLQAHDWSHRRPVVGGDNLIYLE